MTCHLVTQVLIFGTLVSLDWSSWLPGVRNHNKKSKYFTKKHFRRIESRTMCFRGIIFRRLYYGIRSGNSRVIEYEIN